MMRSNENMSTLVALTYKDCDTYQKWYYYKDGDMLSPIYDRYQIFESDDVSEIGFCEDEGLIILKNGEKITNVNSIIDFTEWSVKVGFNRFKVQNSQGLIERRCDEMVQWENQRNEIVSEWYEFIKIYIYNETYNRSVLEYIINTKIKEIVNKIISLNIPVTLYTDNEKRLLYPKRDFLWAEIELSMESDGTMTIEPNDSAKLLFQALGITQE